MTRVAVVGFGELGSVLAAGLAAAGADVVVHSNPRPGLDERVAAAGARAAASAGEALDGAEVVLNTAPGWRAPGAAAGLLVDLTTAAPEAKAEGVDAAVLGTVAVSGFAVPIVASGEGAERFAAFATRHGMAVTAIDGPAGAATRLKLVRSVYLKGRDALVVEMLLAARALGLGDEVVASIPAEASFAATADRVVTALGVHAGRRADELEAAARLLEEAGVDALMSRAGVERLRALAPLRERFEGRRPDDAEAVLRALGELGL